MPAASTQIRDCTQALVEYSKRTRLRDVHRGSRYERRCDRRARGCSNISSTRSCTSKGNPPANTVFCARTRTASDRSTRFACSRCTTPGCSEVANPSELFLAGRDARPSGSCVVASIVGSRPVLIEVQALVGETSYGTPRRLANNLDQQRLAMILAVLERRAGMHLGTHDVYASVAGWIARQRTGCRPRHRPRDRIVLSQRRAGGRRSCVRRTWPIGRDPPGATRPSGERRKRGSSDIRRSFHRRIVVTSPRRSRVRSDSGALRDRSEPFRRP